VATSLVTIAATSRPYPGEEANGDAWLVTWTVAGCRIVLVDGVGHGPPAAAASRITLETLALAPDLAPAAALHRCHHALVGTRGAVISIAQIAADGTHLVYTGIGNIEAQLWQAGRAHRPIAYRGIVGAVIPTVRSFVLALEPDWILLLHTDGVRARFELEALAGFRERDPGRLAATVLTDWGCTTDDAAVVVACADPSRLASTSSLVQRASITLDRSDGAPGFTREADHIGERLGHDSTLP
jgi:Stage II sporulation protein E (SpoIIE)